MLKWLAALALVVSCFAPLSAAEEVEAMTIDKLLAGFVSERMKLESGVFSAEGVETVIAREAAPSKWLCAFSFPDDRIRFDHWHFLRSARDGRIQIRPFHRIVCATPDETFHYSSYTDQTSYEALAIAPPATLQIRGLGVWRGVSGYPDPRGIGVLHPIAFHKGDAFPTVMDSWKQMMAFDSAEQTITHEGDGVYRVVLIGSRGRSSIWFDVRRGFSMVKRRSESGVVIDGVFRSLGDYAKTRLDLPEDARAALGKVPDVTGEAEIHWIKAGGVWVPSSYTAFEMQRVDDWPPGRDQVVAAEIEYIREETRLHFIWSSVNQPLDNTLFDYRSFGLPEGTSVVRR